MIWLTGSTALHDACYLGLDNIVALLLQKGANMNMIDADGDMPIHVSLWI